MARVPLSSGVTLQFPTGTREDAAHLRAVLESHGMPSESILDPLPLEDLQAIYEQLNEKYTLTLVADDDIENLRLGIAQSAGAYFQKQREGEEARRIIPEIQRLRAAFEDVAEAESTLNRQGFVDL